MAPPMEPRDGAKDFPLVCVGGSAGGLDAYIRLLRHLPPDMNVAIVIVNHLRAVPTLLHEILPRHTAMPVVLISDGMLIQPDRVYIIPPKRDLHVNGGKFHLQPISKPWGWPDVITVCLSSLARHWHGKLIAVIVSGFDGDGAAALGQIKDVGGITIAQKLDTAAQPDMPESAIASGYIDFVLSPEDIGQKILEIAKRDAGSLAEARPDRSIPRDRVMSKAGTSACAAAIVSEPQLTSGVRFVETIRPLSICRNAAIYGRRNRRGAKPPAPRKNVCLPSRTGAV